MPNEQITSSTGKIVQLVATTWEDTNQPKVLGLDAAGVVWVLIDGRWISETHPDHPSLRELSGDHD